MAVIWFEQESLFFLIFKQVGKLFKVVNYVIYIYVC